MFAESLLFTLLSVDEFENVSVKKNVTYVMHLVGEIRSWNAVRKKYFWERTRITKYLAYHLMCFDTIFFLYSYPSINSSFPAIWKRVEN